MSLLGTGRTPQAGTSAEAEALIAEARARARRRRRRIAVVVGCAVALAAGGLAAARLPGSGSSATGTAGKAAANAAVNPPGPPAYFVDAATLGGAYFSPEVRASATGKVVAPLPLGRQFDDDDPPYGLAAAGPDSFVLGLMTSNDCSTQFYRFTLNGRGRPGPLTRVGPALPGDLREIAVSAGGGRIGYAIESACANSRALGNYLGVLDTRTGRTRRWTDAPKSMGTLSMSANGRLLGYSVQTGTPAPDGGTFLTGAKVETLATNAPPGTVAARSRVVARLSLETAGLSAPTVLLSPTGASLYLCSQPWPPFSRHPPKRITDTAQIIAYRTATGKKTGVVASFAASYAPTKSGYVPISLGCSSMALDPSGRFLLVPYLTTLRNPADEYSAGSVTAARIKIGTGATSDWTLRFGEKQNPGTMSIAW